MRKHALPWGCAWKEKPHAGHYRIANIHRAIFTLRAVCLMDGQLLPRSFAPMPGAKMFSTLAAQKLWTTRPRRSFISIFGRIIFFPVTLPAATYCCHHSKTIQRTKGSRTLAESSQLAVFKASRHVARSFIWCRLRSQFYFAIYR